MGFQPNERITGQHLSCEAGVRFSAAVQSGKDHQPAVSAYFIALDHSPHSNTFSALLHDGELCSGYNWNGRYGEDVCTEA